MASVNDEALAAGSSGGTASPNGLRRERDCGGMVEQSAAIMGRVHAPGKGLSQSALPYRCSVPTWLKLTSDDVKEQIYILAKKGPTPSQIGVILRDSHGVVQVRFVTGSKILRILKSKGPAPDLPENLNHLIKFESILRGTERIRMLNSV
ncbi:40S ribosomal protein S13 [Myotis brandtii]|uniref:Small ribosomal subunit protein uS15 n=1 Tax=Myotis brandtii TaxID=109478 RepID=S7NY21_MYOBR|nr:40S ribosomal protein S13 [Myotis brandtii]